MPPPISLIAGPTPVTLTDAFANPSASAIAGLGYVWNGSSWDRARSANAADGTSGLGLQGVGALAYDGSNWHRISSLGDGMSLTGLGVSMIATNFVLSTNNSSTAQLASGATFTGVIETIWNQQDISVLLTSDKPGTLTLNQYIDLAGTRLISSWSFPVAPGVPFSRCFTANGNYFNLTFQNLGSASTTTLDINTAYGTLPATTNLGNAPVSLEEIGGVDILPLGSGELKVVSEPQSLFLDPFDAALDTRNRWNMPVAANSAVPAAVSAGSLSLATGTAASGISYLASQPTFRDADPAWVRFSFNVQIPDGASPTANAYRYWGAGVAQASPTPTTPIVNGCGFELATNGKLYAVVYIAGSRTVIADLSSTGNANQPLDNGWHDFAVYYNAKVIYFYHDGQVVAQTSTLAQSAIAVDSMPVLFMALGAATPPSPSAVLNCNACSVSDTGTNQMALSDGTFPWRKATVNPAGSVAVDLAGALGGSIDDIAGALAVQQRNVDAVPGPWTDPGQRAQLVAGSRREIPFNLGVVGQTITSDVSNYAFISIQLSTLASGTLVPEESNDGVNWVNPYIAQEPMGGGSVAQAITAVGVYTLPARTRYFRLRCSAATTPPFVGVIELFSAPKTPATQVFSEYGASMLVSSSGGTGGDGNTAANPGMVSGLLGLFNGLSWDRARGPVTFKTATATSAGNTPLWTPTAGKKFRLMRLRIDVTQNASLATGGLEEITFQDASGAMPVGASLFVPTTAVTTTMGAWSSGWIDLGNGILSAVANNVLNVNLATALASGECRVACCGTEE